MDALVPSSLLSFFGESISSYEILQYAGRAFTAWSQSWRAVSIMSIAQSSSPMIVSGSKCFTKHLFAHRIPRNDHYSMARRHNIRGTLNRQRAGVLLMGLD